MALMGVAGVAGGALLVHEGHEIGMFIPTFPFPREGGMTSLFFYFHFAEHKTWDYRGAMG